MPRFLSALHTRTESAEVRQQILDNLWDEEHGKDNHAELWLRFAEGIGVDRDDVKSAQRNEATDALVKTYEEITREAPVAAGVAALYAYERQVPQTSGSKIEGLARNYGVEDKQVDRVLQGPRRAGHRAFRRGAPDARHAHRRRRDSGRGRHAPRARGLVELPERSRSASGRSRSLTIKGTFQERVDDGSAGLLSRSRLRLGRCQSPPSTAAHHAPPCQVP